MVNEWLPAPESSVPRPAPGAVHIFRMTLAPAPERLARLAALLDPAERERAARYRPEESRRAFTAARGQMRQILGMLAGQTPQSLRFETGARGKPYLPGGSPRFNLTHSGAVALLAVTEGREVGVDIEWTARRLDFARMAPRFFAPAETESLLALPEAERRAAFFRIWTRKEAYIKACGMGLALPLRSFTVSHGDPPEISVPGYSIFSLRPGADYAAALVVEGTVEQVRGWDWPAEAR